MTDEKPLCPLLAIAQGRTAIDEGTECKEKKCAWWDGNFESCAIWTIAARLADLERLTE